MQLLTALRALPNEVVAFTGGGGKTTAMFRLAAEIAASGGRVVTTTTTRIFAAQRDLAPAHVAVDGPPGEAGEALREIAQRLDEARHVLVTGPVEADTGKAWGIGLEWITALRSLQGRPAILIEADGSRMRPFKAPAEHEPVIPLEANLCVPVVGADVFAARLEEARVHRPERVAALAGLGVGAVLTPEAVATVLAHPAGGLKGVPDGARVTVLINKVEDDERLGAARAAARQLLTYERIGAVALGAARSDRPGLETWGRAAGIVLAAGRSTRMGRSKQLLPWGGTTMVGEVVRRLQASPVSQVVVVTGDAREAVEAAAWEAALPDGPPLSFAHNPDFAGSEMARSLQAALRALPANCLAVVVALGDQPRVDPALVERLIARWRETQAQVAAPYYKNRRGHPLLFDRAAWPKLLVLPASANPRQALEGLPTPARVETEDANVLSDVDTPEAYARAVEGDPPE
jgi:molybdenum cofactor cytidylyltransferase